MDFLYFIVSSFILYYGKSTKVIKRLNKLERAVVVLPPDAKDILTGIMLSNGHIQRRSILGNARFMFNQSGKINKRPYFELVYVIFKVYCTKDSKYYINSWVDKKTIKNIPLFLSLLCNYLVL